MVFCLLFKKISFTIAERKNFSLIGLRCRMNSKNVDTFLAVSEFSSISAAAEALFISPPALQQQLNRLEGEIGFRLFERGPGGIRLTQAGKYKIEAAIAPAAGETVTERVVAVITVQ
jgi:hypothetical protein